MRERVGDYANLHPDWRVIEQPGEMLNLRAGQRLALDDYIFMQATASNQPVMQKALNLHSRHQIHNCRPLPAVGSLALAQYMHDFRNITESPLAIGNVLGNVFGENLLECRFEIIRGQEE